MQINIEDITLSDEVEKLIDDEFKDLLKRFLRKKMRTGSETEKVYRSAIQRFIIFAGKSDIKKIDAKDSDEYLSLLDKNNSSLNYKYNQLYYLRAFFEFVENHYRTLRIQYFIPIPSAKYYDFTPEKTLTIEEQSDKIKEEYYTINQLRELMKKSYSANYERFVQIVLLIFCGMRASECITILRENLKIEERYLMTGTEENARKTNKGSSGIYFCFPEEVADLLFNYVNYIENKYPASKWLFPSPIQNGISHTSIKGLQLFLEQIGLSGKTHKFRKSLSTYRREIKGEKTPTYIMETLSNHLISSLEHRTYSQYPIEERRKDYDRYFPTEYQTLLNDLSEYN